MNTGINTRELLGKHLDLVDCGSACTIGVHMIDVLRGRWPKCGEGFWFTFKLGKDEKRMTGIVLGVIVTPIGAVIYRDEPRRATVIIRIDPLTDRCFDYAMLNISPGHPSDKTGTVVFYEDAPEIRIGGKDLMRKRVLLAGRFAMPVGSLFGREFDVPFKDSGFDSAYVILNQEAGSFDLVILSASAQTHTDFVGEHINIHAYPGSVLQAVQKWNARVPVVLLVESDAELDGAIGLKAAYPDLNIMVHSTLGNDETKELHLLESVVRQTIESCDAGVLKQLVDRNCSQIVGITRRRVMPNETLCGICGRIMRQKDDALKCLVCGNTNKEDSVFFTTKTGDET